MGSLGEGFGFGGYGLGAHYEGPGALGQQQGLGLGFRVVRLWGLGFSDPRDTNSPKALYAMVFGPKSLIIWVRRSLGNHDPQHA